MTRATSIEGFLKMDHNAKMNTNKIIRPSQPDNPDFIRNRDIAEQICAYWAERGHSVSLHIVNAGYFPENRSAVHGVRSDMVGGRPVPRATA